MNDLHKLYIVLRHEKTETIIFRFRVSKGLSHGVSLLGQWRRFSLGYDIAKQFLSTLHILFQCHIWIFIRKPTKGKVIFKEEDWLVKAVFSQDISA